MTEAQARAYPSRPFLAASIAVVRDGRVLLAERTRPPAAACFSLPGGLVETGESLQQAALRELMEETGVLARVIAFNDHVEVIERDANGAVAAHFVVTSFVGRWISGDGRIGEEAGRILWLDPDRIDEVRGTPRLGAIVRPAAAIARDAAGP